MFFAGKITTRGSDGDDYTVNIGRFEINRHRLLITIVFGLIDGRNAACIVDVPANAPIGS